MNAEERELAQAAASLTAEDFLYLKENGLLSEQPEQAEKAAPGPVQKRRRKGKRRSVSHRWPEVGTILEADYRGQRYEAEVVPMPRLKSGKALKILTGPAAGTVCTSMSRAMLQATEQQRKEQGLGKSGVANGWDFWSEKEKVPDA